MTKQKQSISEMLGKQLSPLILRQFKKIPLSIKLPSGDIINPKQKQTTINIDKWSTFTDILLGYDLGLAKSFIETKWNCNDLTEVFKAFLISNTSKNKNPVFNYAPEKFFSRIIHKFKSFNIKSNAKKNIRSHYDLNNEFFKLFLDNSMTYSSAYFNDPKLTLENAQYFKIDNLFNKSGLKPGEHILDIGCGWGSLILRAAKKFNCTGIAVTLSKNQYDFTKNKIKELKLTNQVDVVLDDYRNIKGSFDKIFSVEMLEAVGHSGLKDFFKHTNKILKQNGSLGLQVITVPNDRYDEYRKNCDFIQKYIFPGGLLLSHEHILDTMKKNSDLAEKSFISIGEHYVKTLQIWRENFQNNINEIHQIGFPEPFIKKFLYYFSYCEAAFETKHIDNLQIFIQKK
ncbi:MAG: class I SAM-dependent methyltransferase [SAR202 cluster bacterium]|nr:class I SAM-dependent methyltransferase [SAR202 cluster bacterium]